MFKNRPPGAKKLIPKTVQVRDTPAPSPGTNSPSTASSFLSDAPRTGTGLRKKHVPMRQVTRTPESSSEPSPRRNKTKKRLQEDRPLSSDSDSDRDSQSSLIRPPGKRLKPNTRIDTGRILKADAKFTSVEESKLIHAADIANTHDLKQKFKPGLKLSSLKLDVARDQIAVSLQYPGGSRRERYELVQAKDEFDPVQEIISVVKHFARDFLTSDQAEFFLDSDNGIVRCMEKAVGKGDIDLFKTALHDYNEEVNRLRLSRVIEGCLSRKHMLSENLVRTITQQIYDRAVSPDIDSVKRYKYKIEKECTFGELKTGFVHRILVDSGITSSQVFVDLGSGVANVVIQAALQVGCESWGCEIMENPSRLGKAQKQECEARCKLWGIAIGAIHLEEGDFTENPNIQKALQRADVVLVNNEVFSTALNQRLVDLFLDLKDGCQIISLQSFKADQTFSERNENSATRNLYVEKKLYFPGDVSWKADGGSYFVTTKRS